MHFDLLGAFARRRSDRAPLQNLAFGAKLLACIALTASAHAQDAAKAPTKAVAADADAITITGRPLRASVPKVFGTVAVPFGTTPMSARWTRVMGAPVNEPAVVRFTADARGLGPQQQLAFVQSLVNRAVRNHSAPRCTDDGYWAPAKESLARGIGDCVDIAIAKMESLRQLGFSASDLYLITGRNFAGGLEAALLVRTGEQFWLLEARTDQLVAADHVNSFTPVVTYGVGMTWAHGIPVTRPHIMTPSVTSIASSGGGGTPAAYSKN